MEFNNIKPKKVVGVFLFILLLSAAGMKNIYAQYTNHWNVNIHQYPDNMTMTGVILIDNVEQTNPSLEIGAFCGTQCRGSQMLTYYPEVGGYMVFLVVHGQYYQAITFRLYDHSLGQELNLLCSNTVPFVANATYGTPTNPYMFEFVSPPTPPAPTFQVNAKYYPNAYDPYSQYVKVYWGMANLPNENFESGDFYMFDWQNDPTYPWQITTYNPYEGIYCMKSGNQSVDSTSSSIQVTVAIPYDGQLSFFGKISSENGWDYGYFYIDGVRKGSYTGYSNWGERKFDITAGEHTFKWEYSKDFIVSSGDDCFYVDYITFYREPEPVQPGWHTYCEDEFNNAYRSNVGQCSWGYEYPISLTSQYAGYNLTKVSLFSDTMYGAVGGNFTCNIYVGGSTPATGTLASTLTVDVPCSQGTWVEYDLNIPVYVSGNETIWVLWQENESGCLGYPAGCSSGSNEYGNWWNAGGNDGWTRQNDVIWTMKNYFTNSAGRTVELSFADNIPIVVESSVKMDTKLFAPTKGQSDDYPGTECINPNATADKAHSDDRSLQYFRLYRACNGSGTTLIADNVTGNMFIDSEWSALDPGFYQYGVYALDGSTSDIVWSNYIQKPTAQASYQINAIANPSNAGMVTGMGTYSHGSTCTLTATVNENYIFTNWTKNGTQVSTDLTYSFTVIDDALFVANFESLNPSVTQTSNFNNGWTWWSTCIETADADVLSQLKTGLGESGQVIKSQTASTMHMGNNWVGTLPMNNEGGYMVKANAEVSVDITGPATSPEIHPISLNSGWTWIGYPSTGTMTVSEALANHTPQANDVIKGQSASAMYMAGQWRGSLTLTPGIGLMYKSNNSEAVTLTYATPSRMGDTEINTVEPHWNANYSAHPTNMTVLAVVELDGEEINSENYELAAFAGNECRGSVNMMYVEPLDRYMALLTIAGEESDNLRFALYNPETGEECFNADETLTYEADAVVGSPEAPFVVRFRNTTGIDEWANSLQVFPNPVEHGQTVSLGKTDELGMVQVEIIDALGTAVETRRATSLQTIIAPNVAGVYTLRITVEGKGTCYRKLVVR